MSNAAAEHFLKLIAVTFLDRGRCSQSGPRGRGRERVGHVPPEEPKEDGFDRFCCRASAALQRAEGELALAAIGVHRGSPVATPPIGGGRAEMLT